MRYLVVRLCVYYLLMVVMGLVAATVYSGTYDIALWQQEVRASVVLVPFGVMFLLFLTVGI